MAPEVPYFVPSDQVARFHQVIRDANIPGVVDLTTSQVDTRQTISSIEREMEKYIERVHEVKRIAATSDSDVRDTLHTRYAQLFENVQKINVRAGEEEFDYSNPRLFAHLQNAFFEALEKPSAVPIQEISHNKTLKRVKWRRYHLNITPLLGDALILHYGLDGEPALDFSELAKAESTNSGAARSRINTAHWQLSVVFHKALKQIST